MAKRKNNQKKGKTAADKGQAASPAQKAAPDSKKAAAAGKKAPAKKVAQKKAADAGPGFLAKTGQFFREVRIELKKVTWPSRKETLASTSVVLVVVFVVALYLGAVDVVLSRVLKYILQ
jgi:preprotein translocase subunit SecE